MTIILTSKIFMVSILFRFSFKITWRNSIWINRITICSEDEILSLVVSSNMSEFVKSFNCFATAFNLEFFQETEFFFEEWKFRVIFGMNLITLRDITEKNQVENNVKSLLDAFKHSIHHHHFIYNPSQETGQKAQKKTE